MKGRLHRSADMSHAVGGGAAISEFDSRSSITRRINGFLQVGRARSVGGHFCARASKLL